VYSNRNRVRDKMWLDTFTAWHFLKVKLCQLKPQDIQYQPTVLIMLMCYGTEKRTNKPIGAAKSANTPPIQHYGFEFVISNERKTHCVNIAKKKGWWFKWMMLTTSTVMIRIVAGKTYNRFVSRATVGKQPKKTAGLDIINFLVYNIDYYKRVITWSC